MRPWMLKGLERERRKLVRQRRRHDEERIALQAHANDGWSEYKAEPSAPEPQPVARGVWITDL